MRLFGCQAAKHSVNILHPHVKLLTSPVVSVVKVARTRMARTAKHVAEKKVIKRTTADFEKIRSSNGAKEN